MQDDPPLFDYNVEERVNDFVAAALAQVQLDLIMAMFPFFIFWVCMYSLQIYTPQGSVDASTNFIIFSLYCQSDCCGDMLYDL